MRAPPRLRPRRVDRSRFRGQAAGGHASLPAADVVRPDGCLLASPGSEAATVAQCTACHAQSGSNHPAGLEYTGRTRAGDASDLRDPAEVVRRGVFLPGGELRCTTCHDRRSPWKWHIALPPGAAARPAVDPRRPATYEGRGAAVGPREILPPGSAVTAKPLCLACHAID